jgi:hypothetical protein
MTAAEPGKNGLTLVTPQRGARCHAHCLIRKGGASAARTPDHLNANCSGGSLISGSASPPHRTSAGQRARWWRGESSRIGEMSSPITAPRLPYPPRRTAQAIGTGGSSGTEIRGTRTGSSPFTSREGGGNAAITAKVGQRSPAPASLFSETKIFFRPVLLPTLGTVAVAGLASLSVAWVLAVQEKERQILGVQMRARERVNRR